MTIRLKWNTSSEWDAGQSDSDTVHQSVANTDNDDASRVKQGYDYANQYRDGDLWHNWPLHEQNVGQDQINDGDTAHEIQENYDGTYDTVDMDVENGILGATSPQFDGLGDNVTLPQEFFLTDPFLLGCWFNTPDATWNGPNGEMVIFHGEDSPNDEVKLGIKSAVPWCFVKSGDTTAEITGANTVTENSWHMMHVFVDDDSDTVAVELYYDGNIAGTGVVSGSTIVMPKKLGETAGGNDPYRGRMWDWRTYGGDAVPEFDDLFGVSDHQAIRDTAVTDATHVSSVKTS